GWEREESGPDTYQVRRERDRRNRWARSYGYAGGVWRLPERVDAFLPRVLTLPRGCRITGTFNGGINVRSQAAISSTRDAHLPNQKSDAAATRARRPLLRIPQRPRAAERARRRTPGELRVQRSLCPEHGQPHDTGRPELGHHSQPTRDAHPL